MFSNFMLLLAKRALTCYPTGTQTLYNEKNGIL